MSRSSRRSRRAGRAGAADRQQEQRQQRRQASAGTGLSPLPARRRPAHPGRLAQHATVALSGAAVMILELIGTRVIGPFYGVSLYVWTALIAVTLTALALGSWLGGLLADRVPAFGLAHALGAAGLLCAAVPPAARPVLLATDALGLRAGALCSALLLFLPPLLALGTIAPLVIQRSTARLESVGLAAGTVFALSTAGSVAGTLLFGFFLLPTLGSRATLYGLSGVLLLMSALHGRVGRGRSWNADLGSLAALAGLAALPWAAAGRAAPSSESRVLFDEESVHGRVRVVDDLRAGLRWLLSDASTISSADLVAGRCQFPYLQVLEAAPGLRPAARRALVVGVGSGYLPRALDARGLLVDCIELDPAVARAARAGFGFEPPGALLLGDARDVIRRLEHRYDLVVHDCFTGGSMPAHLLSVEALREVERCLTPHGLLALNVVGVTQRRGGRALACVRASLEAVFDHVEPLVVHPGAPLSDVIFLASDGALDFQLLAPVATGAGQDPTARCSRELAAGPGRVLTDDFNPLDVLQLGLSESYRALLVGRMGRDVLGR